MTKEVMKQEQDEPMVLVTKIKNSGIIEGFLRKGVDAKSLLGAKLYTKPQKRKPLTDEEILAKCESVPDYDIGNHDLIRFARAIEAAHGIKD